MVVDELARRGKAPAPRQKFGAELLDASVRGEKALLCKPMEFMNVSGQAVARVAGFWKIAPAETVVVYDELDLPFGQLRLGAGGGHGGHNGVRSLMSDWGTPDFARVRVGIGRPPPGHDPANFILSDFNRDERKELPFLINDAADAIEAIVTSGITAAMNRFNAKKKT
jgi:PTH1 family peptidyl-tRNA hydrolase